MANLIKELPEWCQKDFVHFYETFAFSPEDRIQLYKEHMLIPQFSAETIQHAYDHHEPKENDIMVASFPRTGTTWTREIVRQILYGRDKKRDELTKDITVPHVYLEAAKPSSFNVMHNLPIPRRYFVTHLPSELVNIEKYKSRNIKIIYALRNPKDRMVSNYHYLQGFPVQGDLAEFDLKSWESFLKIHMEGLFPYGMKKGETYIDHILSWLPHVQGNKNAMILVYEDMVKDLPANVKKLAGFLEVKLSEEEINKIADNCKIENMKKSDAESTGEDCLLRHNFKMCRKGEVGQWKEYFTAEQAAEIDREVVEKLEGTGISFVYE